MSPVFKVFLKKLFLIDGCEGSGLIHAFSQHILYRLAVKQDGPLLGKIRVTLLSRSTRYRKILNEDEVSSIYVHQF